MSNSNGSICNWTFFLAFQDTTDKFINSLFIKIISNLYIKSLKCTQQLLENDLFEELKKSEYLMLFGVLVQKRLTMRPFVCYDN